MMHSPELRLGMLEGVLAAVNMGTVVLDAERRVLLWNSWMTRHSGLADELVIDQDFFAVFPDLAGKRIDSAVTQALRDNFPSLLSQTLHKAPFALFADAAAREAQERLQQAVAVTPLAVAGEARLCLIQITDVSAAVMRERLLREQALELRSQSLSDGLTGIANRRHFDAAVEKEVRRARRTGTPLSMLMIDIDAFKAYNDHYGHQRGDDTLIRVASALAQQLQRPHDLIARYGGEEFAVVLPEMDAPHAMQVAEAMRASVAALGIGHAHAGHGQRVTVSIGLATIDGAHPGEVADLVGAADRALYAAKHGGRNRVAMQDD